MTSSQLFPSSPAVKKFREDDRDEILALLDEIDAAHSSSAMCAIKDPSLHDHFDDQSITSVDFPEFDLIDEITQTVYLDDHENNNFCNFDDHASNNIDKISNINVGDTNTYNSNASLHGHNIVIHRLYLPFPLTSDNISNSILINNLNSLSVPLTTKIVENAKLVELNGFIVSYERFGHNYLCVLNTAATCIPCTVAGEVFLNDPCHYGQLICSKNVTVLSNHCIITMSNLVSVHCNHHDPAPGV